MTNSKIPYSDIRPAISKYVNRLFQNHWDTQIHNKLHSINSEFDITPEVQLYDRRDEVVLTRLRIGHTRLTHSFILLGEDPPECIPCGCPLTIKHILTECLDTKCIRDSFYTETNMKVLFEKVAGDIILAFLKEINLFNKI